MRYIFSVNLHIETPHPIKLSQNGDLSTQSTALLPIGTFTPTLIVSVIVLLFDSLAAALNETVALTLNYLFKFIQNFKDR